MRDVSPKIETLRVACARATLMAPAGAEQLLVKAAADKGDALAIARVAGILASKNTPAAIPLCHTLPILHADCEFDVKPDRIELSMSCTTRATTGVEIEALHAVSVAAVTLYDVLKPHTEELSIEGIRLVSKSGGKSDHGVAKADGLAAEIWTIGDSMSSDDAAGALESALQRYRGTVTRFAISSDELLARLEERAGTVRAVFLIAPLGGTEPWRIALEAACDARMGAAEQAVSQYQLDRTPRGLEERPFVGWFGRTLVICAADQVERTTGVATALLPSVLSLKPPTDLQEHS